MCYVCGDFCVHRDETFYCRGCGTTCHDHCLHEHAAENCPRCVGEPALGAVEF
jgi:hypothetical protein